MIDFNTPLPHLNGLSAQVFLNEYWQKKPLLIRNAFPEFQDPVFNPLSPDELAGLAIEEGIHSRLISGSHDTDDWQLEYGPFKPERFEQLPENNWSLLVSDVEKHLPDFSEFIEYFRFIPDWRIDDLMISYAPQGGSVGKHSDEYDVFLLQAHGQRRWQIEDERTQSGYHEGIDIQLVKDFNQTNDWVLNPGDMLYLPPGVAHYGVAVSDCMTWSFGFRAPSWSDLMQDYVDQHVEQMKQMSAEQQRFTDPQHTIQNNPAELHHKTIERIKDTLKQSLFNNNKAFSEWLGSVLSEQTAEYAIEPPENTWDANGLLNAFSQGRSLMLNPVVRLMFIQNTAQQYQVFINGEVNTLNSKTLPDICARRRVLADDLNNTEIELIAWLCHGVNEGYWVFEDDWEAQG